MIAHLRTYKVASGKMDSWLSVFESKLIPLMAEHGIKVESYWVNEDASEFIWIRSYGATLVELEAKEAAFYGSEWWIANVDYVRSHLTGDREIKLIHAT
jgi:hypothetical protein